MNVVLINNSQQFAGTERHMLDLAHALTAEQVNATIIASEDSAIIPHLKATAIPTVTFRCKSPLSAVRFLRKMLRSGEFDILHAHDGISAMQCTLAASLAGRGAVIKTQHFIDPAHTARSGLKRWLSSVAHNWVNQRIDGCIAVSQAARQAMLARNDQPRGEVTIIHNGLSVPPISELPPRNQTRAELGVSSDQTLLLCLARLEKEKNVAALIDAMQIIQPKFPLARCIIAGKGSQENELRNQIQSANLASSVTLLGFRSDAYALLNAADALILPSFAEPFGLVLLEAMAFAKPVIAVNQGGPTEIVKDGETGLLAPTAESESLAAALKTLLADGNRNRQMGNAGKLRYEEKFTTQLMARATAKFYQRILRESSFPLAKDPGQPATAHNQN